MPEEPVIEVLPYAAPAAQSHRRINAVVALGSLLVLCLFYLGLVPLMSSFAFDYTKDIPLQEAVAGVLKVPPRKLLTDPYTFPIVLFIPFAVAALVVFILGRSPQAKLFMAGVAIGIPLVCGSPMLVASPVLFVMVVPAAVLGRCDGEDWSEGMVAYGAVGGWMILWTLTTVGLLWRVKRGSA